MSPEIYSEVFSILKALGNEYIDVVPKDMLNTIKNSMDINCQPKYTIDTISKEKIHPEALDIIAYLNLQFWHKHIDEDNIINILYEN